jgi:hypothetical protein
MWKSLAAAAVVALLAGPALAETWHVMGATPTELLLMETDTRFVHPNGDVSVWTSSLKVTEADEPVVKARWEVACSGEPRIRPKMMVWYDSQLNSKESWVAKPKEPFQAVVPGSRGELTWAYACGKKAWPISVAGSFGEVTGAYANALSKLVSATDAEQVEAK